MNNYESKEIFDRLGIEPYEEFFINDAPYVYRITEDLGVEIQNYKGGWNCHDTFLPCLLQGRDRAGNPIIVKKRKMYHFEAIIQGVLYKFEEQCNKIDYDRNKYLLFYNSNKRGDRLLAAYPHHYIEGVVSVENSKPNEV